MTNGAELVKIVTPQAAKLIERSLKHSDTHTLEGMVADIDAGKYEMFCVFKNGVTVAAVVFHVVKHPERTVFYVVHLAATDWRDLHVYWYTRIMAEAAKRGASAIIGGCRPAAARFFQRELKAKQKMIVMEQEVKPWAH